AEQLLHRRCGPWGGTALDRPPGHSMLARLRARQARQRPEFAGADFKENPVAAVQSVHMNERRAAPSLDSLFELLKADLARVNALIVARMHSPVELIPRLCGYSGEHHLALAAAVEFIHTATLLHDDVVDASDLRRGRDTANAVWGNKSAVLVGDFLFARAFELMVEDGSLRVLDILSRTAAVIA